MCPVRTLHSALGLWRVSKNQLHAQRLQCAAQLRHRLRIAGTIVPILARRIDRAMIRVKRLRNPISFHVFPKRSHYMLRVLRRSKPHEHTARRVVNCNEQTARRATTFEPVVRTAIELHQTPDTRAAISLLAVTAWRTAARP